MNDLTQHRWQEIDTLFKEALEQPPKERSVFLQEVCGTDTGLLNHVEKLLQLHDEAEKILGESADAFVAPLIPELMDQIQSEPSEASDSGIGPYQIVEEIGRGGMGTVYLAKKTGDPYGVQVAVKLLRRGMDTQDVLRRFRHEGQILASLEHPNIARLYDGGAHDDGRPYFVMEYIEGEPIDRYCDKHKLSINQRLKLFITVCGAVQYAHQNLIVHRDIKPAHVMITPSGEVKLVDFGIAKLLEPDRMDLTDYRTQAGVKVMTPDFAAPEQICGKPVTTASDIYSLGVLLYLLLTGRRPYRLGTSSMIEMERIVCETDPPRPSDAAAGKPLPVSPGTDMVTFDPEVAAQLRAKNSEGLRRTLSGDLDEIVLMALRKEPERRYRSALDLAEDLENYLQGKPVAARAPKLGYRAGKFVRRNKWVVAAAAVAIISVLTGLGIALWQAQVAETERDQTQLERNKAEEVVEFLTGLFEASHPNEAKGEELTVRELLDVGADQIRFELTSEPEVRHEMFLVLAGLYRDLALYDQAENLLEEAVETESTEPISTEDRAANLFERAELRREQGQLEEAEQLYRQALDLREELFGDVSGPVAETLSGLSRTLRNAGRFEEAAEIDRRSLKIRREIFGDENEKVAIGLNNLAVTYTEMNEYEEAARLHSEALALKRKLLDPSHPSIAFSLSNLALVRVYLGEYGESAALQREALSLRRKVYGDDHPLVAASYNLLGHALRGIGEFEEAKSHFERALAIRRDRLGEDHFSTLRAMNDLAVLQYSLENYEKAANRFRTVLANYRKNYGSEHPTTLLVLHNLGACLRHLGRYAESRDILEEALERRRKALGKENYYTGESLTELGRLEMAVNNPVRAEGLFREALTIYRQVLPEGHVMLGSAFVDLGSALVDQHHYTESESILVEGLEIRREELGEDEWQTAEAKLWLGLCLQGQGRANEAQPLLQSGYETLTSTHGEDDPLVQRTKRALGGTLP